MRRSIALYGPSGAGKSTIAEIFAEQGYQHVRTGRACRDVCERLFGTSAKTVLNQVTDQMRAIDPLVWLRAALEDADPSMPMIYDSMRFPEDYQYMCDHGFILVRVLIDQDTRLERLRERGQIYDPLVDDAHETEVGLRNMRFDFSVHNDGSISNLREQVAALSAYLEGKPD